jgi:hypothetical protein
MKSILPNSMVVPVYFLGTIVVFSLVIAPVLLLYHYTQPAPIDTSRQEERRKNLAELQTQVAQQLDNYGWIDKTNGRVQLPIRRAMDLMVEEWKDPLAGRSNLLARVKTAFPPGPTSGTQP